MNENEHILTTYLSSCEQKDPIPKSCHKGHQLPRQRAPQKAVSDVLHGGDAQGIHSSAKHVNCMNKH